MRDGVVSVGVEARCCGKSRETATTLSVLTGQVLGKCGLFFFFVCMRSYTNRRGAHAQTRTHIVSSLPYIHLYVSPQYTSVCKYCRAWFEVPHHKKNYTLRPCNTPLPRTQTQRAHTKTNRTPARTPHPSAWGALGSCSSSGRAADLSILSPTSQHVCLPACLSACSGCSPPPRRPFSLSLSFFPALTHSFAPYLTLWLHTHTHTHTHTHRLPGTHTKGYATEACKPINTHTHMFWM